MNEIPQWIIETVWDARRLFCLGGDDWHFYIKMTDKPIGDDNNDGGIHCDVVYQNINVEFNSVLKDDVVGRAAIYHEVLHGAHESIDHLVQESILRAIPKGKRKLLSNLYRDAVENFVQRLARSIVANIEKYNDQNRDSHNPSPMERMGGDNVE